MGKKGQENRRAPISNRSENIFLDSRFLKRMFRRGIVRDRFQGIHEFSIQRRSGECPEESGKAGRAG